MFAVLKKQKKKEKEKKKYRKKKKRKKNRNKSIGIKKSKNVYIQRNKRFQDEKNPLDRGQILWKKSRKKKKEKWKIEVDKPKNDPTFLDASELFE